jgi:glycogen synthase
MQQNVFMIGWEYPPHNSGGLGVACQGLTQALADQNTQLYFTLPYHYSGSTSHMKVIECIDPSWPNSSDPNSPPFLAYSPLSHPSAAPSRHQLQKMSQSDMELKVGQYAQQVVQSGQELKKDFDIIHAHDWMSFQAAWKLSAATKKPYIAHVHSTEYDRAPSGQGSSFITNVEHQGMMRAHGVIAVSYYTKKLLVDKYGINPNKIEVIYNGSFPQLAKPDPGRHHFASRRPAVVFMGRLTMQKGAEFFLDVAKEVLKKIPDALFIIAGQGDMYHELMLKSAYDQLSASVIFSGFMRDKQKNKLLDRADVFVMPSVSEPFGLVALEAAARHTPVIVSKNSGVSEVLKSSIQVDFWDTAKMGEQIVTLLQNKDKAAEVVSGQLDDLKPVTWTNSAKQLISAYNKVFTGKSK